MKHTAFTWLPKLDSSACAAVYSISQHSARRQPDRKFVGTHIYIYTRDGAECRTLCITLKSNVKDVRTHTKQFHVCNHFTVGWQSPTPSLIIWCKIWTGFRSWLQSSLCNSSYWSISGTWQILKLPGACLRLMPQLHSTRLRLMPQLHGACLQLLLQLHSACLQLLLQLQKACLQLLPQLHSACLQLLPQLHRAHLGLWPQTQSGL